MSIKSTNTNIGTPFSSRVSQFPIRDIPHQPGGESEKRSGTAAAFFVPAGKEQRCDPMVVLVMKGSAEQGVKGSNKFFTKKSNMEGGEADGERKLG
nr:hypothetical protein [Evansella caseinilytica]